MVSGKVLLFQHDIVHYTDSLFWIGSGNKIRIQCLYMWWYAFISISKDLRYLCLRCCDVMIMPWRHDNARLLCSFIPVISFIRSWEIGGSITGGAGRMEFFCIVSASVTNIWPIHISWREILHLNTDWEVLSFLFFLPAPMAQWLSWASRYWVPISVPAPTQSGFLKVQWVGVRPLGLHPVLAH